MISYIPSRNATLSKNCFNPGQCEPTDQSITLKRKVGPSLHYWIVLVQGMKGSWSPYLQVVSPARQKSFVRLHDLSQFTYIEVNLPTLNTYY